MKQRVHDSCWKLLSCCITHIISLFCVVIWYVFKNGDVIWWDDQLSPVYWVGLILWPLWECRTEKWWAGRAVAKVKSAIYCAQRCNTKLQLAMQQIKWMARAHYYVDCFYKPPTTNLGKITPKSKLGHYSKVTLNKFPVFTSDCINPTPRIALFVLPSVKRYRIFRSLFFGNEKSYRRSAGVKRPDFWGLFRFKKKMDFWMTGLLDFCTFWISG